MIPLVWRQREEDQILTYHLLHQELKTTPFQNKQTKDKTQEKYEQEKCILVNQPCHSIHFHIESPQVIMIENFNSSQWTKKRR